MTGGGLPSATVTYASAVLYAALVSAGLLTIILVPYKIYRFNFGWAKLSAAVVYLIYTVLGIAAGFGGYEAMTAIGWQPAPHSSVVTGVLFGAFGWATARVHLGRVPGGEAADVLTLLSLAGEWLAGALDWHVKRAVDRRLWKLPPEQLAQYVTLMFERSVKRSPIVPQATKKQIAKEVKTHVRGLKAADETDRSEALTALRVVAADWVREYKFDCPRPE